MLKIRLRRQGSTHAPFYRIVVSDSRLTPRAATVEQIGTYDPARKPAHLELNNERVEYWVGQGAKMSDTVKSLFKKNAAVAE